MRKNQKTPKTKAAKDPNVMVPYSLRLPNGVLDKIKSRAKKEERSTSWMMVRLLKNQVEAPVG